jgi:hypothetical protein
MASTDEPALLTKLDALVPASLAKFDAFPKLTTTYRTRSESRGFMTIFVILLVVLLLLNDVGEFLWGWPDYEFSVDSNVNPNLVINLDMVVGMPCSCKSSPCHRPLALLDRGAVISVDLRDAMGDRLFLSGSLRREGVCFLLLPRKYVRIFARHSSTLAKQQN